MANYPDWVMKYKKPGLYVNKSGDKYRLYKGHCEYRNGKPVRVVDEYLGTITEADGLIPSKGNVKHEVLVYEYGLFYFLFLLFENIYSGQKKLNKSHADSIMYFAIIDLFDIPDIKIQYTSLGFLYPKNSKKHLNQPEIINEISRVKLMMKEYLKKVDLNNDALASLSTLTLVSVNKRLYLSKYDPSVDEIYHKYGFEVKIYGENR